MSSNHYRIIAQGRIGEGFSADQVNRDLRRIFSIDEQRAAGLFAQPNTVIKSGLGLEYAEKYRDRLTRAGLSVVIEAEAPAAEFQASAREAEPDYQNPPETSSPASQARLRPRLDSTACYTAWNPASAGSQRPRGWCSRLSS